MPRKRWNTSPIASAVEARRQLAILRSGSENRMLHACHRAAVAIHAHVTADRPAVAHLTALEESLEEMVAKFRASLPPKLRAIADVRALDQVLHEQRNERISEWATKFGPKERTSESAVQALEEINAQEDALRREHRMPVYMAQIQSLHRTLSDELELHAFAWAARFAVEGWAKQIAENNNNDDAELQLSVALRLLIQGYVADRQKKTIELMLLPIVACACAALNLECWTPDEMTIFLVSLNSSVPETDATGDAKPGELDKFKERKEKWRGQLTEWLPRIPTLLEVDRISESDNLRANKKPTIKTELDERWRRFAQLSPDAREEVLRSVAELPASPLDEDLSEFLDRVAELLPVGQD